MLVVTPKRATARWARRPIPLGGGNAWTPLVVGPDDIPPVTDSDRARELPELGALSIIAHGKGEPELAMRIAKATLHGLEAVGDEDTRMYFDLIESHLSQAARKALAMTFEGYQFQSKFGNKRFAEGKAEGRAEGRAEGKLEGRRAILRRQLTRKFGDLPADALEQLERASEAQLDAWAERILDASSLDDVLRD